MSARAIRLLHVEDDVVQRRLLGQHLKKLTDLAFDVKPADSEDEALAKVGDGFDIVLLDYHLAQGNGLNCLRKMRQQYPHLPIIAVSGVATPEIAAELLEAGADDYFSKENFDPELFARSVRAAIARADAWRARAPDLDNAAMSKIVGLFEGLCKDFTRFAEPDLLPQLDDLERLARQANLTFAQTLRIFESVCERLAPELDQPRLKRLLRPIMLEVVLRLFEEAPMRNR